MNLLAFLMRFVIIPAARIGKSPGEKSLDDIVKDAIFAFGLVCCAVGAWLFWHFLSR